MNKDVIIVGGGIAGLTAAAYLAKDGYQVLLCEKEKHVGGLVSSFVVDGFLYDAGVRGIVDSGIVKPMLKELGINVDFTKSIVSIGIEKEMIQVRTEESLEEYRLMLYRLYPNHHADVDRILKEIRKVMEYMDVLYGIENPLFKDMHDKEYLMKTVVPWFFRYLKKIRKISDLKDPVDEHLAKLSTNQSLIDIISQHFFQKTPASFALSYFSLYLDYEYPVKGTKALVDAIESFFLEHGGIIKTDTLIESIDLENKTITSNTKETYSYQKLIWTADQTKLYQSIDTAKIKKPRLKNQVLNRLEFLKDKRGGDSIYSMFVAVDLDQTYFKDKTTPHCFYTPSRTGHASVFNNLKAIAKSKDKSEIFRWMEQYLELTTFEIAIPSLRNAELAPKGKTGLVISVLMDYDFIKNIETLGYYQEFKAFSEKKILEVLSLTIFPSFNEHILHCFSSTPLTIEKLSGNKDGGITGWAFTNSENPAVDQMAKVAKSCLTPLPNVYQAGQWTFSPSGLPISILTGKFAVNQVEKVLKKRR